MFDQKAMIVPPIAAAASRPSAVPVATHADRCPIAAMFAPRKTGENLPLTGILYLAAHRNSAANGDRGLPRFFATPS